MISRPRFQLPSLLSWLWEQDAESITSVSANQSAEAHHGLRRTAAIQHNKAKIIIQILKSTQCPDWLLLALNSSDVLDWNQCAQKTVDLQYFMTKL